MILCRREKLFLICLTGILWGCLGLSGIGWAQPLNHLPPDLKTYINEALQAQSRDQTYWADLRKASEEAIWPAGALYDPMSNLWDFATSLINTYASQSKRK